MAQESTEKPTSKKNNKQPTYIAAVGRRREAVARVRLYESVAEDLTFEKHPVKKGDILVNGVAIQDYFNGELSRFEYSAPLRVANAQNKYTFTIKVSGGGKAGQLDAVVHGLSMALADLDPEQYRKVLKDKGFLTRDSRVRERRKVGTGGKARRAKQSPKR